MFAKISHAYEIIKDEDTRKSYNLSQLHNDQKGYDPNGPAYYDSSSTTPTATGTTKQKTNQNKKNENKMMNQQQLMTTTNHSCWLGRVWVFTGYRKIKKARVF
jgi:curved DNA-binding protein CbpA